MKTIKHIFQLKLTSKEVVRSKQILALIMVPLFIFQMSSLNLAFINVASAEDETPGATVSSVSDKSESEDDESNSEEVNDEDNGEEEDRAASEESDSEEEDENAVQQADEETSGEENADEVNIEDENGDEEGITGDETEGTEDANEKNPVITPEAAATTTDVEASIEASTEATEEEAETEDETAAEEPEWQIDGDKWTIGPVELGKTYKAPQNEKVTITFTELPDEPGNLSIEEITLSDEQVAELGALSSKAYDITSDMEDGTFEYDLTLPKPSGADDVQIKYAEDESELDDAKTIDDVDVKDDKVKAEELDHFTIFIVTSAADKTSLLFPEVLDASSISKISASDNDRYSTNGHWPQYWVLPYQQNQYLEFTFSPNVPNDAIINGANLIFEYQRDAFLSGTKQRDAKIRAWDGDGFDVEIADYNDLKLSSPDKDETKIISIPSELVNTPEKINNFKIRFYMRGVGSASNLWLLETRHDYVGLDIDYANPGSITIIKDAVPNDTQDFEFKSNLENFSLDDDADNGNDLSNTKVFSNLAPGQHTITEPATPGWSLTDLSCSGGVSISTIPNVNSRNVVINLAAGENITCTFTNTKNEYCGNGTVDSGEQCDDGNSVNTDDCLNTCKNATCGDGFLYAGNEQCDNGENNNDSWPYGQLGCSTSCINVTGPHCGDDITNGSEQCDGGENCSATCEIVRSAKITKPVDSSMPAGIVDFEAFLVDDDADPIQWAIRKDTCAANTNTIFGNVDGKNDVAAIDDSDLNNQTFSFSANMDPGEYCFVYNPTEDAGESEIRLDKIFEVIDAEGPVAPEIVFPGSEQYFNSSPILNDWDEVYDFSGIKKYRVWYSYDDNHSFSNSTCGVLNIDGKNGRCRDVYAPATSRSHAPSTVEQGGVTIRVQAIDNADNEGAWSEPVHYYYDETAPVVTLNGDSLTIIEKGTAYADPGATCTDNVDKTCTVNINSTSVDTSTLGTYTAYYDATDNAGNVATQVMRTVNVVDQTAPEAPELLGDSAVYMQPGSITRSWKRSASDDVVEYIYKSFTSESAANMPDTSSGWSPSPTPAVFGQETYSRTDPTGDYERIFWWRVAAVDASGNKTWSEEVYKVVVDKTAPEIKLNGDNPIIVEKGAAYVEPGATWTDNIDGSGDVSDISETVDINTVGDYTITYSKTDRAGNTGSATRIVQVSDTQKPDVPTAILTAGGVSVPDSGYTNSKTFTFNLSSSSNDVTLYKVKYWNGISGDNFEGESKAWSTNSLSRYFSDLNVYNDQFSRGEGKHYFAFSACDAANNCSNYSEPFTATYDDTPPTVPGVVFPGNEQVLNSQILYIDWDESTDNITTANNIVYQYRLYTENPDISPSASIRFKKDYTGTTRHPESGFAPGTPEGSYWWRVQAVDQTGNESGWTVAQKLTVDNTAPDAPMLNLPVDGAIVNGNPQQSWNPVSDVDHYVYESWRDVDTTNTTNFIWREDNLKNTSRTVGGMQTITFYWRVMAVDTAGNESTWSEMRKLTVDNTLPTITNVAADKDYVKAGDTITITADVTDNTGISAVSADFAYDLSYSSLNRPLPTSISMAKVNGNTYQGVYTVPDSWNDGVMYIKVAARDLTGGNWIRSDVYDQVVVDNIVPTSIITSPANEGDNSIIYSSNWDGSISGTASDDRSGVAGVKISIQEKSLGYWTGSGWQINEFLLATTGTDSWSYNDLTSPEDGEYTIKSHTIDNAGNVENTYSLTIISDKTIPEVSLTIDPANPDGDNNWYISAPTITLKATDANFEKIEYQIDSNSGTWIDYSSPVKIDEGKHIFYYRAWDLAGNVSGEGVKNVKVDTEDPDKVSDLDAEYDEDENSVKLTWDADDDDINKVYIYRGGSRGFNMNNGSLIGKNDDNDETFTDDDVERGEKYYYKLVSRDEAGNKSGAKVISIEITEEGTAIVTDEGIDNSSQGSNSEEGQEGSEEDQQGEEIQGASNEGGTALGEETQKGEGTAKRTFWIIFLIALLGLIFYLLYRRRKNRIANGQQL